MDGKSEPAENEGEQKNDQDKGHERVPSFYMAAGREPSTRRSAIHTSGAGPENKADRRAASAGYGFRALAASLTFSPACLTLPFVWSAAPSASSRSLPTALPVVSLILPLTSSALLFALSAALTAPFLSIEDRLCPAP